MDSGMDQVRVLLVDDDPALLDALSQTLQLHMEAPAVDVCESADDAISHILQHEYDAIISDIKMPGIDGLELLKGIQETRPGIPVLLITGHGEKDLAIQALRLQAYDLIQKPIDRDYLLVALKRAIEAKRLRMKVQKDQEDLERYAEELELRVEERTEELAKANRAKDEFLGLLSHEINNPLTVIVGFADMLHRGLNVLSVEEIQSLIVDLRQESHRLRRIVENLLVLSRAELGTKARTESVNLSRIVEAEVGAHCLAFPHRKVDVICPGEVIVDGDPTYIELILRNLLSNAEKYSDDQADIQVQLQRSEGEVSISVLDRGPGISPSEASRVFDPFYRSDTISGKAPGMGIGLAVCKRLIETQGGSISVSPRPGGGTEFSFCLFNGSRI